MTVRRTLLDTESDTPIGADHSLDLALALLGFVIIFIVVVWRWRTVLFQEWMMFFNGITHLTALTPPPPPPGLKKAALQLLPSATYTADMAKDAKDCAICLTEFADGDLTRALPQCGHLFHVICVDKWLRTCSSCPSCRQLVTVISKSSASQMV